MKYKKCDRLFFLSSNLQKSFQAVIDKLLMGYENNQHYTSNYKNNINWNISCFLLLCACISKKIPCQINVPMKQCITIFCQLEHLSLSREMSNTAPVKINAEAALSQSPTGVPWLNGFLLKLCSILATLIHSLLTVTAEHEKWP